MTKVTPYERENEQWSLYAAAKPLHTANIEQRRRPALHCPKPYNLPKIAPT